MRNIRNVGVSCGSGDARIESKAPEGDRDTPINWWTYTRYSGFGKRTLVPFIVTLVVGVVGAAVLLATGNWDY